MNKWTEIILGVLLIGLGIAVFSLFGFDFDYCWTEDLIKNANPNFGLCASWGLAFPFTMIGFGILALFEAIMEDN